MKSFLLANDSLLKEKRIRVRVFCILNVNFKHILTAKIVETSINEINLAIEHLVNLNQRFDLKNFITIYDRRYASLELIMKTMDLNSKFLIRLPKKLYLNAKLKKMKTNDEIIEINITNSRLKYFNDIKIKRKSQKKNGTNKNHE